MILNARRSPLCALPLLCSVLLGQPQTSTEPPAIVIRSTTRLVQVNVVVRDRKGNAVTGLTRDDFILEDDGKPQDIRVFAFDASGVTFQPKNDRWTADLEFVLVQTGAEGREYGIKSQVVHLELLPEMYENVRRNGYIRRESLERQPGATSLRVLVRDVPSGNIGRVIVPFAGPPR